MMKLWEATEAAKDMGIYDDLKFGDKFAYNVSKLLYGGDYLAWKENRDDVNTVYEEHQGEYVEEGLADAKSYFNKEEELEKWDDILKQFEDDGFTTEVPFESAAPDFLDAQDVYDAMEQGAADGTEKGVKNALSGDYNLPGTYMKLSQNGLRELSNFDNFGMKRTGDVITVKNDINITISAEGQNAAAIASMVEEKIGDILRGSSLPDY